MNYTKYYFMPAGVLLGLGIGMALGHTTPGILIGVGAGLFFMALFGSDDKDE
jgi:mannose/fructose/N-acetylgalactosamine-specific phosphotransferase system component IIC